MAVLLIKHNKKREEKVVMDKNEKGKRAVVLEENNRTQKVMTALLTCCGYSVRVAESYNLLVAMLASNHFDLVLLDMQVPQRNNLSLEQAVRLGGDSTFIVAMASLPVEEGKLFARQFGIRGYLRKPFRANTFRDVITGVLS